MHYCEILKKKGLEAQPFLKYVLWSKTNVLVLCQELLYLLIDVLASEAKLLVKHLVRSRESEALETPDGAVGTYQAFEVDGQTGGETELLRASGQDSLLVLLRLAAELPLAMSLNNQKGSGNQLSRESMKMKELGLSIDVIVNTTGLSLDEVEALLRAKGVSGV